jgi:hypothetical protein
VTFSPLISFLQFCQERVGILDIGSQENTAQGALDDPMPNDEYERALDM